MSGRGYSRDGGPGQRSGSHGGHDFQNQRQPPPGSAQSPRYEPYSVVTSGTPSQGISDMNPAARSIDDNPAYQGLLGGPRDPGSVPARAIPFTANLAELSSQEVGRGSPEQATEPAPFDWYSHRVPHRDGKLVFIPGLHQIIPHAAQADSHHSTPTSYATSGYIPHRDASVHGPRNDTIFHLGVALRHANQRNGLPQGTSQDYGSASNHIHDAQSFDVPQGSGTTGHSRQSSQSHDSSSSPQVYHPGFSHEDWDWPYYARSETDLSYEEIVARAKAALEREFPEPAVKPVPDWIVEWAAERDSDPAAEWAAECAEWAAEPVTEPAAELAADLAAELAAELAGEGEVEAAAGTLDDGFMTLAPLIVAIMEERGWTPATPHSDLQANWGDITWGDLTNLYNSYFNSNANLAPATASNESKLDKLFDELREFEEDTQNELSAESVMAYATSLGVDPEKAGIFALMELLQAPSLGTITRQGFVDGWKATSAQPTKAGQKEHIRLVIRNMQSDAELFKRIYRHAFVVGKETPEQRAVPLENALIYWQCFFGAEQPEALSWVTAGGPAAATGAGSTDWLALWSEYLRANWSRTVNKDMWNMTLLFAVRTLGDPNLSFWAPDGAWPSVIDSFVVWVRAKYGISAAAGSNMEVDS